MGISRSGNLLPHQCLSLIFYLEHWLLKLCSTHLKVFERLGSVYRLSSSSKRQCKTEDWLILHWFHRKLPFKEIQSHSFPRRNLVLEFLSHSEILMAWQVFKPLVLYLEYKVDNNGNLRKSLWAKGLFTCNLIMWTHPTILVFDITEIIWVDWLWTGKMQVWREVIGLEV